MLYQNHSNRQSQEKRGCILLDTIPSDIAPTYSTLLIGFPFNLSWRSLGKSDRDLTMSQLLRPLSCKSRTSSSGKRAPGVVGEEIDWMSFPLRYSSFRWGRHGAIVTIADHVSTHSFKTCKAERFRNRVLSVEIDCTLSYRRSDITLPTHNHKA